jgi:alkylated DNA nucleotide flippase Atl1
MANPTTNFGWVMPTSTDLVTDLPADFAVFGQAVDTSMADLKGGTTGQILAKATNTDMDFTWIANDQGDITAVNTTAPLAGGGTSGALTLSIAAATTSVVGAVQLSDSTSTTSSVLAATPTAVKSAYDLAAAAVPKSTVTTAGDVIYATGSSAVTRLGIGTAGQVLAVNSGATAPEWKTVSSGGYTSIASGTLTSAALNITSIPGTYKALVLEMRDVTKASAFDVNMQFNTDTAANYDNVVNRNVNGTLSTIGAIGSTAATVNGQGFKASTQYNQIIIKIDGYTQTDMWKVFTMYGSGTDYLTSGREVWQGAGSWKSTSAVTSIQTDSTMSMKYTLWGLS